MRVVVRTMLPHMMACCGLGLGLEIGNAVK